jgi:hypothetical protein
VSNSRKFLAMADEEPALSPKEIEDYKRELIKSLTVQLKEDGLLDLTGWIETYAPSKHYKNSGFVRSVAFRMERDGLVEVIPIEDWKRFYIKELTWDKKHPYLHAIRLNIIGTVFALCIGIILGILTQEYKDIWHKQSA